MIRTKLIEAREKRGWTQEQAACELSIDVVTLHRWEHGVCKPRGYNKQKLLKVYEASAYELGLEGISASPESGQTPVIGNNLLEMRLLTLILQWPRNRLDYDELRRNLRQEIEESMTNEINRRRALELLATLPISVFSLSSERPVSIVGEEAMPWITGGITASWHLGRGSDLSLASSLVSSYIPTLKSLTQQPRFRKTASDLAAQAYLLKATLGWHLSTPQDAISYAQEAENHAKIAQNPLLQVDALHRQGMAFYYLKRYDQAVKKLEEAIYLVEHQKVPRTQARHLYLSLAAYQAASGNTVDAKISMKKAQKYYGATSDDPISEMLGYENGFSFLRWEGIALAFTGAHSEALDSYSQAAAQHAPVVQRSRVELLCNQLQSKLRLKDKDLEECVALWTEAITGAKKLQSEQRYAEAISLYETMLCVWPGEASIAKLRDLIVHW